MNVSQYRVAALLAAAGLFGLPECAWAQRATASVAGAVRDASESAVPSAAVTVQNIDTGVKRSVVSNELGYYVVTALPAGRYTLTATREGFQTHTIPEFVLQVDQNATMNVDLQVGAVTQPRLPSTRALRRCRRSSISG